ncbi:MAG TPA: TonB family protein [Longimicrobiales bacterium]|nr:TonB family protein [Longimicrobiales bacterium]
MTTGGAALTRVPTTRYRAPARHILHAVLTVPALAACASMGGGYRGADMVLDCEVLSLDTLDATMVAEPDMPRLVNEAEVQARLEWLMDDARGHRTQVQLLVQPNGFVSHGCVREASGDADFDRAALEAAREARFQPATRGGVAVPAWVMFWLGLDRAVDRAP